MIHFQDKGSELYAGVIVTGDTFEVVRERETIEDLTKVERSAAFLWV